MEERSLTARLGYSDVLRCLAALAVVVLHCAGASVGNQDPASASFFVLNFLDGATRWSVPVFLMLTGMFLLDPNKPMPTKKWLGYLGRVATATLVWGFFYAFYDTRAASHNAIEWMLEALIRMVKGELHHHLWYLPMLLGLYLLVPSMRALVKGASRRVLWYLIGLWGVVTLCLGTLYAFFPTGLGRPWLDALKLSALSGYMGYLLLGYLLRTCRPKPLWEGLCYALGVLGLVVTCTGTRLLSLAAGGLDTRLYGNFTPNVCLTAAALFLLGRRLNWGGRPGWAKAASCTFGVYLIHPLVLELLQNRGLPRPEWNVAWAVPAEALFIFLVSLAAAWVLRHIPKVGKYIC